MIDLRQVHRVQDSSKNSSPFSNNHCPIRRVIVSDAGEIKLNPDSEHFIYFSRTKMHHAYYIYSKVLKIITKEIEKAKADPYFAKLDLPDDFRAFRYYTHINTQVIKEVNNLFTNYLPPKKVELVTLQYLNAFSELFELCATKNHQKNFGKNYPEISDTSTFGGAYGINDAWLELLKACIVSSKTCTVPVNSVLEELLEIKHIVKVDDQRLKSILTRNEAMFEILEHMTYTELQNPEFQDKNTPNKITNLLELIEEHQMYAPHLELDHQFFGSQRKHFKDEYHDTLESIR